MDGQTNGVTLSLLELLIAAKIPWGLTESGPNEEGVHFTKTYLFPLGSIGRATKGDKLGPLGCRVPVGAHRGQIGGDMGCIACHTGTWGPIGGLQRGSIRANLQAG